MIRKLSYSEIDFEKYENCLENSVQRKYSATKDFLDITTNKKWDLLVYKDYEAVMPVPFVRKLGIKIVINPMLCQQLGVFSPTDCKELNDKFIHFLQKKYQIISYSFNDGNQFKTEIKKRKNYLIYPDEYIKVYSKYSPKRKRKLRSELEIINHSEIKICSFPEVNHFINNNFLGAKNKRNQLKYISIFKEFYNAGLVIFYAYFYQNKITNVIAIYTDKRTNVLLGTFNDKDFVKISGASILIDYVIKNSIHNKTFDFEGSELPNVEEFFRGFRPELKPYPYIEYSIKDILIKFLNPKFLSSNVLK